MPRGKNKGCLGFLFVLGELKQLREEEKMLSRADVDLESLNGDQFEHFLYILFKDLGYKVSRTSRTGDFGADLIIEKDDRKSAIQAKRYSSKVGVRAVQEVASSKKYYRVDSTAVITTDYFTKSAKELAIVNEVMLIDRRDLLKIILERNKKRETFDKNEIKGKTKKKVKNKNRFKV